jgi:hypothetical protein
MAEVIECPQCGSTGLTKISVTEYHCPYCNSNFTLGMSKADMIAKALGNTGFSNINYPDAKNKKLVYIIIAGVIMVSVIIPLIVNTIFVHTPAHKSKTGAYVMVNNVIENASVTNFKVYGGSRGPVIWMLQTQSVSMQDSSHFILSIIEPKGNKHLKDFEYVPAMTWDDAFHSDKCLGEFHGFGDTCWNASEQYGLRAFDIYTGKIIIDGAKLGRMHPELGKGITKVEWNSYYRNFTITTNDGFEYVFLPDQNKMYKKKEFDEQNSRSDKGNAVIRNFFVLTDSKRPELFISTEKTSSLTSSAHSFDFDFDHFDPNNKPFFAQNVISVKHILPDLIFFNGHIAYSDNDKVLITYQNSVAKNSPLHISCIGSDGKIWWNIYGNAIKSLEAEFSANNQNIVYGGTKKEAVLFYEYGDHNAIGIDWKSGKILWQFNTKKEDK